MEYTAPGGGVTGLNATGPEINNVADVSAGAVAKAKRLSITSTPTGSEEDTTWDLPTKSLVTRVWLDVTTAEVTGTTKTMSVGLKTGEGGSISAFLMSADCSATGIVSGTIYDSPTFVIAAAVSLSFKADDSDWAEFRGDIYVEYVEM